MYFILGAERWYEESVSPDESVMVGSGGRQGAFLIQTNQGSCIVGTQPNYPYLNVITSNETGLTFAKGTNWTYLVITNNTQSALTIDVRRII